MKKNLLFFILPSFFFFFTVSCLHYEEHYRLNDSGSGTVLIRISIQQSMLELKDGMSLPFDFDPFETNREKILAIFSNEREITVRKVVTSVSNLIKEIAVEIGFRDINRLPKIWFFKNREFLFENDGNHSRFQTAFINRASNRTFFEMDDLLSTLLENDAFSLKVDMPGKIVTNNPSANLLSAGRVEWKTRIAEILQNDKTEWSVKSRNGIQGFSWKLAIGAAIFMALGMALLFTVGNRKRRNW